MTKLKAFLFGMYEFRRSYTRNFGWEYDEVYGRGREFAHKLTFRRYDYC